MDSERIELAEILESAAKLLREAERFDTQICKGHPRVRENDVKALDLLRRVSSWLNDGDL